MMTTTRHSEPGRLLEEPRIAVYGYKRIKIILPVRVVTADAVTACSCQELWYLLGVCMAAETYRVRDPNGWPRWALDVTSGRDHNWPRTMEVEMEVRGRLFELECSWQNAEFTIAGNRLRVTPPFETYAHSAVVDENGVFRKHL